MANELERLFADVDPVNDPPPSRALVDWIHRNAGTDRFDLHHKIGHDATDAAAGDHDHDGRNSGQVAGAAGNIQVPFGAIIEWPGSAAPAGWHLCDGTAISRTGNPRLFALFGTTYGVGDGSTTFNLPNLKGRIPVGRDSGQTEFDTLGETGGAKTHTLTVPEIPSHTHSVLDGNSPTLLSAAGASYGVQYSASTTGATGGGGAHNNLQPYLVLNYIIALG